MLSLYFNCRGFRQLRSSVLSLSFNCRGFRRLRLSVLSFLGVFVGALFTGSGRWCSRRWERPLVAFVGSGRRWLSSEAVFGAIIGSKPEMVIDIA